MDFTHELNSRQLEAVMNTKGPALVIAGAGSGKTRVLTYRIAQLLSQGVPAYRILALTFTNKAAREMQHRIAALVGETQAANLWMGTFHSIFGKILRLEAPLLGYTPDFTIYDAQDSKNMIKQIMKELQLDDKIYNPNAVQGRISMAKNMLVTPDAYARSADIQLADKMAKKPLIHEIYRYYATRCKKNNVMDFDDLLLQTNILFRDFPDTLEKYQRKFEYILVDEYQDTNYSQYLIIKKLAALNRNICVVGDDAQSIYSFRGARIENILNFKNDYPEYSLYKLEQNYRSTVTIVGTANSVIAHNEEQIPKELFSRNEEGEKIKVIRALTDREEGVQVVNEIYRLAQNEHQDYSHFAILYRTNAQSRLFEEALRKQNIPYRIYGGTSFYQRKEVKDLLAYLRLAVNQDDEESLRRVINYPRRGIGETTVEQLRHAARAHDSTLWHALSNVESLHDCLSPGTIRKLEPFKTLIESFAEMTKTESAYHVVHRVVTASGIVTDLETDNTPEGISRKENIQEFLNAVKAFSETAYKENREDKLAPFLAEIALLTDQDNDQSNDLPKVTLMTVHSAKGLEFPTVCVVGLEETLFPSIRSSHSSSELAEERRLFYVALTRAEKRLILSHATTRYHNGEIISPPPSRFLQEIHPRYIETPAPRRGAPRHQTIARPRVTMPVKRAEVPEINTAELQPAAPEAIVPGVVVYHPSFGTGQVISIEGLGDNRKAKIDFPQHDIKVLLLKFAKLFTEKA
ncbi:MAG: UvrD-helicase domain-containing protein [Odoribacteraceae bacterium]|jgi:DNA helicase-2/ATP-dependent DNA helicase PcrA|nr:UvrD-helicase domain-containing protein [Odoribacteraceae bacterium]